MKIRRALVPAICIAVLIGCTAAAHGTSSPNAAPPGKGDIRAMAAERDVSTTALIDALANADAVLIGEIHDNEEHHRLQAWLIEQIAARGRQVVVAFEMIGTDQDVLVSQHLAKQPGDAAGLGPALNWDKTGWPAWHMYQPIAAAALHQATPPEQPLRGAGLPRTLARAVVHQGLDALPPPLASQLALTPNEDQAALAVHEKDMDASHCGMLPEHAFAPFALAQYARDAQMARVLADAWRESDRKAVVVLIAGSGHTRRDIGAPLHLRRMAPDMRVATVGLLETTTAETILPYDYVLLTPVEPRDDPCAGLPGRKIPSR